ncbi:MAG: hypothetical protein DRI57_30835, partial [Deltaproteobacteria bacterium]
GDEVSIFKREKIPGNPVPLPVIPQSLRAAGHEPDNGSSYQQEFDDICQWRIFQTDQKFFGPGEIKDL